MTDVLLRYRRTTGTSPTGSIITTATDPGAVVRVTPVQRFDTTDGEMLPTSLVVDIDTKVTLEPGPYWFEAVGVFNGVGGKLPPSVTRQCRMVPTSTAGFPVNADGSIDIDDLVEISPSTAGSLTPEIQAYIDAQIANITGGGPGSVYAIDILDSTLTGRNVIKATDAAAARTAIGAGTGSSNLALGTTSTTAAAGTTVATANSAATTAAAAQAAADAANTAVTARVISPTASGLYVAFVFVTSSTSTARPTVASSVAILWVIPGATTAPVNIGPNDLWFST